jgi:hypothetical protein
MQRQIAQASLSSLVFYVFWRSQEDKGRLTSDKAAQFVCQTLKIVNDFRAQINAHCLLLGRTAVPDFLHNLEKLNSFFIKSGLSCLP